jgi:hypothetical protein
VDSGFAASVPCTGTGGGGLAGLTFSSCTINGGNLGNQNGSVFGIAPSPGSSPLKFTIESSEVVTPALVAFETTTYTPANSFGNFGIAVNLLGGGAFSAYNASSDPPAAGDWTLTLTSAPPVTASFLNDGNEHGSLHVSFVGGQTSDAGGTATLDVTF